MYQDALTSCSNTPHEGNPGRTVGSQDAGIKHGNLPFTTEFRARDASVASPGTTLCTRRVCWRCLVSPFLSSLSLECQKQLVLSAQEVLPLLTGVVSAERCLVERCSQPCQGHEMGCHREKVVKATVLLSSGCLSSSLSGVSHH